MYSPDDQHSPCPQKVEIVFWHWWSGDNEVLLQEVIDRFEEDYPGLTSSPNSNPGPIGPTGYDGHDQRHRARCTDDRPGRLTNLALQGLIVPSPNWWKKRSGPGHLLSPELAGLYWQERTLCHSPGGATDNTFYYNKRLFRKLVSIPTVPQKPGKLCGKPIGN